MTKKERFHKVAVARTQKVLDEMDLLSHCSRTAMYEFTPEEVEQIMGTRTRPIRATPPPAISCLIPWDFAYVR
jgi:hypothetical protein